jgi:hypothetical protein
LDLETNQQVIESQIEDNFENGKEYAGFTKTLSQNLTLEKQVLIIEERPMRRRSLLPQEVVRWDVWTGDL